jgi:1-acyl-sn-glycerol-3-phosphate acyltransferase
MDLILPTLKKLFGETGPAVEILYRRLTRILISRVKLEDFSAIDKLRGRSVLYLANHQTQIESILFSVLLSGLQQLPVIVLANAKHRDRWVGKLVNWTFAETGQPDPGLVRYFDQNHPELLAAIIDSVSREMTVGQRSLLVHVEGTRQRSCREEVQKVSSIFPELAIRTGVPIVPVRFSGGLPVEPLTGAKHEFPAGYCGQEYRLGSPIFPEELHSLSLAARRDRILDAIRDLGNPGEVPGPARNEFAAVVDTRVRNEGISEVDAVLSTLLDQSRFRLP